MTKPLDVTVSIVSFNTKEYLERCIESICKYTNGISFEVIVVDNASSDGTQKMVEKKFPKVKIIKNKINKYYGGANNQALKIAKGRYFLILNADTYFTDNSIKKIVKFMDKDKKVGAVEGLEIYEDGRLVPNGSKFTTPLIDFYELSFIGKRFKNKNLINNFRYTKNNRRKIFTIDVGCDAFLMVRSDTMRKIKGYDDKLLLYYTENDLCLRLKKEGYKVIHFGKAYVYHTVSVSANKLRWKKLDLYYHDLYTYYKKNGHILSGSLLFVLLKLEKLILYVFRPNMFEK